MNYKVGEKVWIKTKNKIGTITELNPTPYWKYKLEYKNGWECMNEDELHDTFDTMITMLGFEKGEETKKYISANGSKIYKHYCCKKDNKYKNYRIFVFDKFYTVEKLYFSSAKIDNDLHEALTQLMVELEAQK